MIQVPANGDTYSKMFTVYSPENRIMTNNNHYLDNHNKDLRVIVLMFVWSTMEEEDIQID
jgi:hypothetical protein